MREGAITSVATPRRPKQAGQVVPGWARFVAEAYPSRTAEARDETPDTRLVVKPSVDDWGLAPGLRTAEVIESR